MFTIPAHKNVTKPAGQIVNPIPAEMCSSTSHLQRVIAQRNELAALIDALALIPADDFYKPGDHAADLVNKAWQAKNRILGLSAS